MKENMQGIDNATDTTGEPWPDHFVAYQTLSSNRIKMLRRIIDEAEDERPIQKWLEENPEAMLSFVQGEANAWVFGRPRLGSEFIPDFMICVYDSRGFQWHLVELESPKFSIFTKSGNRSAMLTHALDQISEWRIWLRDNIRYAQNQLRYYNLDAEFQGHVVIGRRRDISSSLVDRYRELSRDNLIQTYDRLIERIPKED